MLPRQLPSTTRRWRLLARTQSACVNCDWPRKPRKPSKPSKPTKSSKRPIKPLPGDVVQQKASQAEPERARRPDVRGRFCAASSSSVESFESDEQKSRPEGRLSLEWCSGYL